MLVRLQSLDQLNDHIDEITEALRILFKKGGEHGSSPTSLMKILIRLVKDKNGFVLIHVDEYDKVDGLLIALGMPDEKNPWIEVLAVWARTRRGKRLIEEGHKKMIEWGDSFGAVKNVGAVIRAPEAMFKHFYEPLGYKKIGFVIERRR